MIVLGYLAMVALGLLPLAATARAMGVEADRTFLFSAPVALVVAFVLGFAVCLVVGRVLGLLRFEHLHSYESRRVVQRDARARLSRYGGARARRARAASAH